MFDQVIAQLASDGVEALGRAAVGDRMAAGRRLQAALTAWMGRLSCHADGLGDGGLDGAGMLRVEARMSSAAATVASRTAAVLEELPSAAASLAAGRITAEHARTLAHAAEKVATGKVDAELVAVAEAAPADLFARRAREWVGRNQDPGSVADEHDRARRQRNGSLRVRRDGVRVLHVEFDPVSGREVESHLADACDAAWRKEGGRDADPETVRSHRQRLADVVAERLVGAASNHTAPRHPKFHLAAVFDISRINADLPGGAARLVDGSPLPRHVLEFMACDAAITPIIFDGAGTPIWVGRDHRTATIAQWKALIARDGGCVGCGADPGRCEAHHVVAWDARGPTDITNLVLVCRRCHHDIHDRGMEMVQTPTGWAIEVRAGPVAA